MSSTGRKITFGQHLLWPLTLFFWRLPVLWRVGNRISDFRFWVYMTYGWEWI